MRYRVSNSKVVWRIVDGEVVLLHADTSAYFGLNEVGTLLWGEMTDRGASLAELVAWTKGRFPGAPPDVEADLAVFLGQLEEHDLVEVASGDGKAAGSPPGREGLADGLEYEPPRLLPFGELEKLILSGE